MVADEGFDGRVVVVRNAGLNIESDLCGGAFVEIGAGETGTTSSRPRSSAAGSASRPSPGIPGTVGRDPDPERRRLRPGDQPDPRPRAHLGPQAPRLPHLRRLRVQLRLPHQPLQAGSRPPGRGQRDLPVPARRPRRSGPVRRAGQRARRGDRCSGPPPATCARPCWTCVAARRWCSTPRTTTPGAPAPSSPTRSSPPGSVPDGAPAWPHGRRTGQDERGVADRAAGFTKGYGNDRVRLSSRHTLAITNRAGPPRASCSTWPARSATGCDERFGIDAGQRAGAGELLALSG